MSYAHSSPRWLLPAVAVLLFVAPFIAACGDDDDDNGDTTPITSTATTSTATGTGTATGTPTTGGNEDLDDVTVMGLWGSEELTNFEAMTEPWRTDHNADVDFTGTRNITAELTLRVEGNNPPDIAIPAEVGLFQQFVEEGKLISLDQCAGLEDLIRDNYPDAFVNLGEIDGKLYGFFMKADTKGTIWYSPQAFEDADLDPLDADASFDDLVSLSNSFIEKDMTPWSIGVESAESSGWAGTDWIQQIILNEHGEDTYDGLIDGSVAFTDPMVKDAWEKFGEIALGDGMTVQGGAAGINATNFQDSTYPPFQDPPQAAMVYLGGFAAEFITTQFPSAEPETDFDFFTFPGGAITGGANIVYAFNNDPETCSFLSYLASAEAQEIWVEAGGFTSVNEEVSMEAYPSDLARRQAEQLIDAESFRFDLDDAIGGGLQQAYFQGVTQYLSNPGSLDSILQQIEAARGTE
ncbi:MAG: extracellular solute-binding protein [Dehalococcoidia bacterium]|nr:extracellular solute-binding protein [Dehalococcoidia bacterium]